MTGWRKIWAGALLVSFYPLLVQTDKTHQWHPALQRLAELCGALPSFCAALRARILPRANDGSLETHLCSFLAPLSSWETHPQLEGWAMNLLTDLENWVEDEVRQH